MNAPLPALFQRVPAARAVIPWTPLGRFPTRLQPLDGLVPRSVELWVKREDECSRAFGGNKVRKLEFALAEARARRSWKVVTFGGYGSHHVAATALHAPSCGLAVEAVVFPQPVDDHVRELILAGQSAGAQFTPVDGMLGVPVAWARALMERGTSWISGGGSSLAGTIGYVSAGFELLEQFRAVDGRAPDVVYVALGSAGTFAGLCWSLWAKSPVEVVGVDVVGRWAFPGHRARSLLRKLDASLGALAGGKRKGVAPRVRVERAFAGHYGLPTEAGNWAVARARRCGLELDPIYTGKVMAALLADAAAGRLDGKRVLFVHTMNTADLRPAIARGPGPDALPAALREALAPPDEALVSVL